MKVSSIQSPENVAHLVEFPNGIDQERITRYLQEDMELPRPITATSAIDSVVIAETSPSGEIIAELSQLCVHQQCKLADFTRFTIYFAQGSDIPKTLQALGSGREKTFRSAGQGTAKACDLSAEDEYYHHLVLWDRERSKVAGSYRIGLVKQILADHGTQGLYLDRVFKIDPALYEKLGSSLELSRSYVLPEYQGESDALAGLWKGVGIVISKLGIKNLFGAVTISNDHHPVTRSILVEHLKSNYRADDEIRSLVEARSPFIPITQHHRPIADAYAGQALQKLSPVINAIENGERGIPPLMRYYCNIGARFLDYHVEADFGDSVYCLLQVAVDKMPPSYLKRFIPDLSPST